MKSLWYPVIFSSRDGSSDRERSRRSKKTKHRRSHSRSHSSGRHQSSEHSHRRHGITATCDFVGLWFQDWSPILILPGCPIFWTCVSRISQNLCWDVTCPVFTHYEFTPFTCKYHSQVTFESYLCAKLPLFMKLPISASTLWACFFLFAQP